MMASLLIVTLFWNLLAPLPPQIAINPETKECGSFWGGDEYVEYRLAPPWQIINYGVPVQIGTGVYKWDGSLSSPGVESFCNKIGYGYVAGNLGKLRGEYRRTSYADFVLALRFAPWIIAGILGLLVLFIFLRWRKKRSKVTPVS